MKVDTLTDANGNRLEPVSEKQEKVLRHLARHNICLADDHTREALAQFAHVEPPADARPVTGPILLNAMTFKVSLPCGRTVNVKAMSPDAARNAARKTAGLKKCTGLIVVAVLSKGHWKEV